nr:hypothetical protein [Candidatus Dadabacteria bacterium]
MKKIVLSVLLISCLSIHETLSQGLLFRLNGSDIKKYNLDELSRITKPAEITIYEPHELRNRTYTGFSTADLLKNIYKENLQNNKVLYITCTDGYKPSIPVVKFLTYPSYLVFKASGDEDFMLINKNQNNEAVELKPFYLIWDNIKHPELREQGAYDFPYQIESVDLISFEKKFSKMSPPASSSDRVKRGFVAYIKYCSTCHTMNGEGGSKA